MSREITTHSYCLAKLYFLRIANNKIESRTNPSLQLQTDIHNRQSDRCDKAERKRNGETNSFEDVGKELFHINLVVMYII